MQLTTVLVLLLVAYWVVRKYLNFRAAVNATGYVAHP